MRRYLNLGNGAQLLSLLLLLLLLIGAAHSRIGMHSRTLRLSIAHSGARGLQGRVWQRL